MLCAAATTEWEEEDRLSFLYIHDDIIFFAGGEDFFGINFGPKWLCCCPHARTPPLLYRVGHPVRSGGASGRRAAFGPTFTALPGAARRRAVAPILNNALKADT